MPDSSGGGGIWQNGSLSSHPVPYRAAVTGWRQNRARQKGASSELHVTCAFARSKGNTAVAVKIKLTRLGKIRNPQYRIVVADSRTRRNGRAIETIGKYHPKEEPSLIEVDSERAQYWLGVGAQPTEPVLNLLKITGDWQKFKGLPGAEGTLRVKEPSRPSWSCSSCARAGRERAAAEAITPKKKKPPRKMPPSFRRRCRVHRGCRVMSAVVADAVEHLVRGIVANPPDDVRVELITGRRGRTVEVHVHPPDDLAR